VIFVTVGAQMAFDRLIAAVDAWALAAPRTASGSRVDVFAQIGPSELRPQNIRWTKFLAPGLFRGTVAEAEAVVAHAGMGTILTTLELGRPLIVMPRLGDLGETRNDHQVATAERFRAVRGVRVALDTDELTPALDGLLRTGGAGAIAAPDRAPAGASPELVAMLREFVFGRAPAEPRGRRRGET
jgi:UDP-N-acetylglucosamine transferase subunit ALG13